MMEPENDENAGNRPDPADQAADAALLRWADTVVPLPAPPYGFERVLVRAHRRKVRRRAAAGTASMLSVALLFGGLIAGGVLPGPARSGQGCPAAAAAPATEKGSPVNRRTEYAIGGALAVTALTAGVLAGCTGNSGTSPSAAGTSAASSPTGTPSGSLLTLPGVTASTTATSPAGSATTVATVPECQTVDVSAAVSVVAGSSGAGGESLNITLTNTSGHSCSVTGFPGLGLEDKNQDVQPSKVTWDKAIAKTTITLGNGESASSTARFDPDIPGPGEATSGPCESASVYMLVTPPNNQSQQVVTIGGTSNQGITVCNSGALDVYALVPGAVGPRQ